MRKSLAIIIVLVLGCWSLSAQVRIAAGRWSVEYDSLHAEASVLCDGKPVIEHACAWVTVQGVGYAASGRALITVDSTVRNVTLEAEHFVYKFIIRRIFTILPDYDRVEVRMEIESGDGRIAVDEFTVLAGPASLSAKMEAAEDPIWNFSLEESINQYGKSVKTQCLPLIAGQAVDNEIVRSSTIYISDHE